MATARVDAAAARLELAQLQLERAQLTSPIDGQVLEVNLEAGELTGPDAGEPAIVLADTSRTRVRAFVEELDAARVQIGMPAIVDGRGTPRSSVHRARRPDESAHDPQAAFYRPTDRTL